MLRRPSLFVALAIAGAASAPMGACFYDWSGGGSPATSSASGGAGGTASTSSGPGGGSTPTSAGGSGGTGGSACGSGRFPCLGLCCNLGAPEACVLDYDAMPTPSGTCTVVPDSCDCSSCELPGGLTWSKCCGSPATGLTYQHGGPDTPCP